MRSQCKGWVSLPILFAVAVFSWSLMKQSKMMSDDRHWLIQHEQLNSIRDRGKVYLSLVQLRQSTVMDASPCESFCSLSVVDWRSMLIDEKPFLYQLVYNDSKDIERWCVTEDQRWAHCWWLRNDRRSYATVYIE